MSYNDDNEEKEVLSGDAVDELLNENENDEEGEDPEVEEKEWE